MHRTIPPVLTASERGSPPLRMTELAHLLGASDDGAGDCILAGLSTDTRDDVADTAFFAFTGERFDGHAFVADAFAKGAAVAVVEHPVPDAAGPQLIVPDAVQAFSTVAAAHRRRFAIPVVGVVGSVGKTTTKDMIAWALQPAYRVNATYKNWNNDIGVAKTLLALTPEHTASVIEMGMRGAGQIAKLAAAASPTIGVCTKIGRAHLGRLGSRRNIAAAKGELFPHLPPDGVAVLNADDPYFRYLRSLCRCPVLAYGTSSLCDVRISHVEISPRGVTSFRVNGFASELPAGGRHHVANAAAACAVALALGIDVPGALARLRTFRGPLMRMQIMDAPHGVTVINDAFNASPDSVVAALATLVEMARRANRRSVAVLGDMTDLGARAGALHRATGRISASLGVDLVVAVGNHAADVVHGRSGRTGVTRALATAEETVQHVWSMLEPHDLVLVKASHSANLELVVRAITGRQDVGRAYV